jgi:4-amino-4-deoxy-L-arabinose transferase-like glycosyltransferase
MGTKTKGALAVLLLVAAAFALRAAGTTGRGYPFSFYPDEGGNLQRAVKIYRPGAASTLESFDLNLHWFNKPSLGFYLNFAEMGLLYVWGNKVTGAYENPTAFAHAFFNDRGPFYLVTRLANCLWAALTVFLVYRIGKRLWGRPTGLAAGLMLVITPGHVLWSQVVKHDILAGFFAALSFLFILKIVERGRWRDYIWAGLFAGLGAATKYSPIVMGLPMLFAHVLRDRGDTVLSPRASFGRLAAGMGAILGGFFIGSPFNFLDDQWYRHNLRPQAELAKGLVFGAGEVDPSKDSFFTQLGKFWNILDNAEALGMGLILLALVGLVVGLRQREHRRGAGLIGLAIAGLTFVFCAANQQYPRENHLVPIYPFTALLAGFGAVWLLRQLRPEHLERPRVVVGLMLVLLVPLPGMPGRGLWQIQYGAMREHPQTMAFNWIQENIPEGATILNDHEIVDLAMTDKRLEWVQSRIEEELERSRGALAKIKDEDEKAESRRNYRRERITRYEGYQLKYGFLAGAAGDYKGRRYDAITLLKPWQEDDREKFKSRAYGYNDLWAVIPLTAPTDLPPIERYRLTLAELPADAEEEQRRGHPVLDQPADYIVTRKESYSNYESEERRKWWPEWAAFYDDLRAHYDCWEFPEDWTEQGLGTVRIYDLRKRVEGREPQVTRP